MDKLKLIIGSKISLKDDDNPPKPAKKKASPYPGNKTASDKKSWAKTEQNSPLSFL